MVDVYPQYATVVAKIDLDHARQAQFLRLSIELEAVRRLTADASAETAKDLREVLVRQAAVATQETDDVFDSIDREFHRKLYEKTGILELWASVRRQSVHLDRLRRLHLPMPGKMQTVLTEHEAIVDAIASGRPAHAEMALRKHLCATLSIIDVISSEFPTYIRI
ncbi:GntR family transcriptional regulator [Rhizobium sp. L51/94]|uniref:GntR family transcriptional regulator n=1 Tax=Rhizobium sp. L51/94 TaxID=2819999 RepID=UPI00214B83BD|nr:GntR family transcriptional regulator [Rhizobium sp. L51/94]